MEKINVLGTIIDIENPAIVKHSIVLLFLYFSLRYWQYYKEENYVKDMHHKMREYLYHREEAYLRKKAREKANFPDPESVNVCFADPRYYWGVRFVAIPENKDIVIFPFMRQCEFYIYPESERPGHSNNHTKEFHSRMASPEYSCWSPIFSDKEKNTAPSFYGQYLTYSIIKFNLMRLVGACGYMLNESYFTDYQLPFIVAVVSVIVTGCANFI